MFGDNMTTPATPERVYALCKLVEKGPQTVKDLQEKMEPSYLSQTTRYFADYKNTAEELGLILTADNTVSLAADRKVFRSTDTMRGYINGKLYEFRDGMFGRTTRAVFGLDWTTLCAKCAAGGKGLTIISPELQDYIKEKAGAKVDAMAMRAWRFWAPFLGLGYMQEMFFIPNAYVFLKDILSCTDFKRKERITFDSFMERLMPFCLMLITEDDRAARTLNYGVSSGLRMLHDVGAVKLEHIMDQQDTWRLYPMQTHPVSGRVSHITVLK